MTYTLNHEPEGHKCNMEWTVRDADGELCYRGPWWAARYRWHTWNQGREVYDWEGRVI
jgi:hypothetical protein